DGVDVTDLPPHMRQASTQPLSTPLHDPLLDAMPDKPEFEAPIAAPQAEKAVAPVTHGAGAEEPSPVQTAAAAPVHQPLPAERKLALDGLIDA
ncbi:hypothetical protein, partial [Salmonella sp. s58760]|uniref:hypothetical protein n=1 Tax=Salmonella sp. s58760 TaxID=3159708 RepID=UPI0039800D21